MKETFKITIEHYDEKVSIEKNYSDVDASALAEMLHRACLAAGYLPSTVDEIFNIK